MVVSNKGLCANCKHCAVFNHKEDLAICLEFYALKDAERGALCFEAGSRIVLDCAAFASMKERRIKHE